MSREKTASDFEEWARRQAVHVVSQLPENFDEALAVLEKAKKLIHWIRQPASAVSADVISWKREK